VADEDTKLIIDACKQQFEFNAKWSQIYHDCEIKISVGAIGLSSLSSIAGLSQELLGRFSVTIGQHVVNIFGVLIIMVSIAAMFSVFGYYRYYEICDIYAKNFRNEIFKYCHGEEVLERIKSKTRDDLKTQYPIISRRMFENAHHFVLFGVHFAFLIVGLMILPK